MNDCRGVVWVTRKKKCTAPSVYIRDVDPAVGAHQSVLRFRDQDTSLAAHDPLALRNGNLGHTRVQMILSGPSSGTWRRHDAFQLHDLAFGLGYDFVFHDQNVARY